MLFQVFFRRILLNFDRYQPDQVNNHGRWTPIILPGTSVILRAVT